MNRSLNHRFEIQNLIYYLGRPRSIGIQTEVIPDAMLTRLNQLEKEFMNSSEEGSGSEEELEGLNDDINEEDDHTEDEEESDDNDSRSKSSKNSKSSKERDSSILTRATSSLTNFFSLR